MPEEEREAISSSGCLKDLTERAHPPYHERGPRSACRRRAFDTDERLLACRVMLVDRAELNEGVGINADERIESGCRRCRSRLIDVIRVEVDHGVSLIAIDHIQRSIDPSSDGIAERQRGEVVESRSLELSRHRARRSDLDEEAEQPEIERGFKVVVILRRI